MNDIKIDLQDLNLLERIIFQIYITLFVLAFATYVYLYFKGKHPSYRPTRRTKFKAKTKDENNAKTYHRLQQTLTYNREICPICLSELVMSVRASCGHLLCADCLANYCDVRVALAPPPCPLCRAPLDKVALACDDDDTNISNNHCLVTSDGKSHDDHRIRSWIREYNLHCGLVSSDKLKPPKSFQRFMNLLFHCLKYFLIIGLVAIRLKILPLTNHSAVTSVIDITLGVALIMCVFFKYQDDLFADYDW